MTTRSHLLPAAIVAVAASTVALVPVFTGQGWLWASLLGILLAFGTGALARRLDVPGVLSPALSLLALFVFIGVLFFRDTTVAGIPTTATLDAIGLALNDAGRDIRELAAPVDVTRSLTVLTAGGVYLVAVVVDLLVFRARRPAVAGLPLLTLYLVPTSFAPDGGPILTFVIAAAGYVALLVAEGRDRARGWGRRLVGIGLVEDLTDLSPVARVGRRLGAAAVGVAIVVPVFVPSLGDGLLDGGFGDGLFGEGDGPSSAVVINPIVDLRPQLRDHRRTELLRVRTDQPAYLRLTSLDKFNGQIWSTGDQEAHDDHRVGTSKRRIPLPPELSPGVPREEVDFDIEILGLRMRWLPVPYIPHVVRIDSKKWVYDEKSYSVFSSRTDTRRAKYTATSVLPAPSYELLDSDPPVTDPAMLPYLETPGTPPSIVEAELGRITEGATSQYQKAVRLQEYFRISGGFTYSLQVEPGNASDDIAEFLNRRTGYCEQFAAAMAYMARLAGIPARVAIGFTKGIKQPDDSYLITNREAHAWPELYFPSVGWLAFEPTPRDGTTVVPSYTVPPVDTGPDTPGTPSAEPTPSGEPTPAPSASTRVDRSDEGNENQPAGGTGRDGGRWLALLLVVAGLTGVGSVPALAARANRRARFRRAGDEVERANAAWQALADAAEDTGYALRPSDSPRTAAARLVRTATLTGEVADAVRTIAAVEERARYARTAPEHPGLPALAATVRTALFETLRGRSKLRALLLPASTLRRAKEQLLLTADGLDRRQAALWARLRRATARA